jgi:hypothetical protein
MATAAPDFDNNIRTLQIRKDVDRLILVIDGDAGNDVKGLRPRVVDIEKVIEQWTEERAINAAWRKGVSVGLTAFVTLNAAGLGFLIRLIEQYISKHP